MSWWELGQYGGRRGSDLALDEIECAFCGEEGNWEHVHRASKKKPNGHQQLFFDTYKCGNCAGFVMVFWSSGQGTHDFRVLPWPQKIAGHPKHWPPDIGRYWLQAKRNHKDQNWDAAAMMAASALQLALRSEGAEGKTLNDEVKDLAGKGILPPIMVEWANEVRWLRNPATHPEPGQAPTDPKDASDIVRFLDFLLEYLLDLPHQINKYRERRQAGVAEEAAVTEEG